MKQRDDGKSLSGFLQVGDAYLGGKRRGGKRDRGTPGKTPFIAAVATNEKGPPLAIKFNQVNSFAKAEITDWAQKHIRPDCTIVSDGLGCFAGFDQAGSRLTIIIGGGPDNVQRPEFKWTNTIIGNVINAIRGTYHAVSTKHAPRYLAESNYRPSRRFLLDTQRSNDYSLM